MDERSLLPAIVITTVALLLLFTATVVVMVAAHRHRRRQDQLLCDTEIRYQRELRSVEAEVQEKILERFSFELHNNLGQKLTLVHTQLQQCTLGTGKDGLSISDIDGNVVEALIQVTTLSRSLNADVVTNGGIMNMVRQEVERLKRNGEIVISFKEQGEDPALNPDQQLVAFRIFQEAVNNAMKHSEAAAIYIGLTARPMFTLEIFDNGKGFNPGEQTGSRGAGLRLMRNRSALAGLNCEIISKPDQGTVCRITEQLPKVSTTADN